MLNVEEDLRAKKMPQPGVGLHDPEHADIEAIPFVSIGLTDLLRLKNKAEKARVDFLASANIDSSEYFANVEYNNQLKYWAVVYCVSIDDEAAYKANGLAQVENYVENYLGSKFYGAYESLALEILDSCGVELLEVNQDESEVEDDGSDFN